MGAEKILIENPKESAWLEGMRGAPDGGFHVANQYTAPEAMVKYLDQMAQANIKHAIKNKGIQRGDGRDAEVRDIVWIEYIAQLHHPKNAKDDAELKKKRREL